MNGKMIPLDTPGDMLAEVLDDLGVTAYALAKAIGKKPAVVSRIINGHSRITPNLSLLIGKALDQSPAYWFNLQVDHDIRIAARDENTVRAVRAVKTLPKAKAAAETDGEAMPAY